jgi:hypothetical protein
MAAIYGGEEEDQMTAWNRGRSFELDEGQTLISYWLRQLKSKSTHRVAQLGLDMASIPAMSSECERVFSQGKLLITGQHQSTS